MSQQPSYNDTGLSARSLAVFSAIVEDYIGHGHPVSSRAVARLLGGSLSSATIRNVMVGLEERQLIHAPHTSAGRVPTIRGYRLFVDRFLVCGALGEQQEQQISAGIDALCEPRVLLEQASGLLSGLTRLAGLVSMPRQIGSGVRQVEFVSIGAHRVLAVLVMQDGSVCNQVFTPSRSLSTAELRRGSDCLNDLLLSMSLEAVRQRVMDELRDVRSDLARLVAQALDFAAQSTVTDADYVITGEINLMSVAELYDVEKLRRLFETFSQKRDLLMLLNEAIHGQRLQVFIGDELGYAALDGCSLVVSSYQVDGQPVGALGVLGPTRMPYEQVIPVVDATARVLGNALSQLHH